MNTDKAGFRYAADERAAIFTCAPREHNEGDWRYLETIAAAYQNRSFETMLHKGSAIRIEKTARRLELQLRAVPPLKAWPRELSVRLKVLSEIQAWAKPQQLPKSQRKRSNRARPDAVDGYLAQLVQFYIKLGGRAGKAPSSRCARFVVATASSVLGKTYFEMAPTAISHLIRSRVWLLAQDFGSSRPEVGAPTLTINEQGLRLAAAFAATRKLESSGRGPTFLDNAQSLIVEAPDAEATPQGLHIQNAQI